MPPRAPYGPYAGYVAPAYAAAPAAAASSAPGRDPRVADAHADRVVLVPTAYTHPAGTWYFSTTDIVFLQAGYAVSDVTQITLSGTPPLGEKDKIFLLDASLKTVVARDRRVRVAAIGSMSGLFGLEEGNFVLGRAGAVTQLCFDLPCESSATLGASVLFAGPATLAMTGAGAIWRIADWAALLLEIDTLLPLGGEVGEYSGVAVMAGFRFPYRTWSLDLSVARGVDTQEEPEIAVVPLLTFTYRVLP